MHRFQRHLAAAFAATLLGACGGGHAPTADELSSSAHDAAEAAADREQPAARKGNTPPAVALVADAGVRSVTLNWSDNGASRYDVYLSSSRTCDVRNYTLCPDGRMLPNVRPPYKVDTLDNGRVYYAQV
jgi:outer membrane biogenesis lipoprotein LolB